MYCTALLLPKYKQINGDVTFSIPAGSCKLPKAISFIRFGVFSAVESKFKCAVCGSKQVKFRYTNNSIKDVCLQCEGFTVN